MRLQAVTILMVFLKCTSAQTVWSGAETTTTTNESLIAAMDLYNSLINNTTNNNSIINNTTNNRVTEECYAEGQQVGKCVKTSLCEKEAEKIDPNSLIEYRNKNGPRNVCGFLKICCPLDKVRVTPVIPARVTAPGCGYSNAAASVFRAGSPDSGYADFAEFPWMVALLKNQAGNWTGKNYIGGGTLIHPSVVLTTAHKVDPFEPNGLKVRAGEWDVENENENYEYQERVVDEIILHEQFDVGNAHNDVALLFLVKPFEIQPHINVGCLSPSLPAPGTVCYSMGWGEDFTRGKYYASVLKKVTLPLMAPEECERRYRKSRMGPTFTLHRSLICAGGQPNVDTCFGDGGSPLVCPIGEQAEVRYAVVGMVAWGLGCGAASRPGMYASVPEAYNWVARQLDMEGVSGRPYVY